MAVVITPKMKAKMVELTANFLKLKWASAASVVG